MKIIDLTDVDKLSILGYNDTFFRLIKSNLISKVTLKNNIIEIVGEDEEKGKIIFEILKDLYKEKHQILKEDVYFAITTASEKNHVNNSVKYKNKSGVKPRTKGQERYWKLLSKYDIVFAIGPAGTGKTYLAVAKGIELLKNRLVGKLILVRPAVEAGESLGFLPGDMKEKVDPYLRPIYDALYDILGVEKTKKYMERDIIEVAPLAYMRGRTLNNAFIIMDEAQNTTHAQMKMFLTRIGTGSRAVITGDITQIDLERREHSGLVEIIDILKNVEGIGFIHLTEKDVVRHHLVGKILEAYRRYDDKDKNK